MQRLLRLLGLAALLGIPAAARGQAPTVVHVSVADTLGQPLPGVSLQLVHDTAVVRAGRTARDGDYRFFLDRADGALDLVVRQPGFVATRRRVIPASGKTIDVGVLLTPTVTVLDSVRVAEHRTASDIMPSIGADEIARSGRNLTGLFNVIDKLRPTFMPGPRYALHPCFERGARLYINEQLVNPAQYDALNDFPPDQIALIQFVDCFDRSIDDDDHPGARHIYVTLEPAAHYSVSRGVYVDSAAIRQAGTMADSGKAVRVLRGKLVGVYDALSGDPIAGVQVKDLGTGMSAVTTVTGTVSLFFSRNDDTAIGFSKLGYKPLTLLIGDPWADSIPMTVMLMPRGVSTIEHKRLSPADTVKKLAAVGFYDRRAWSSAPAAAFLGASELRGETTITAAAQLAGRPLCESAVYVDGAFTNIGAALAALPDSARTIDQLFPVSSVLAIETYVGGEIPPQFDRWSEKGTTIFDAPKKSSRCVTAIWTR